MKKKQHVSRRKFLQTSSVLFSLPFLESLAWQEARAQVTRPLKLGFLMFPMGHHVDRTNNAFLEGGRGWLIPDMTGGKLDFSRRQALQQLEAYKNDLLFPLNFYIRNDNMNDSPHLGFGQFLTCAGLNNNPYYPAAYDRNLRSIDQYIGTQMKYNRQNLEHLNAISIETYNTKNIIDGYETKSKSNVYASWKAIDANGNQDLRAADEQVEYQPLAIFNKLFPNNMPPSGGGSTAADLKNRRKRSILDSLVGDLTSLRNKLSTDDKEQLDRYTASVRDLEMALVDTNSPVCTLSSSKTFSNFQGYGNNASQFRTYTKQMMDVFALGMACDHVKLLTYAMDNGIYGRQFALARNIEFHSATHLDGSFGGGAATDLAEEYRAYVKLWVEMYAYFLQLLKANGSLDSSLVVLGSGMNMIMTARNNASNHCSQELGIILAGKANGLVTPGRTLDMGKAMRLGTLWQKIYKMTTNQTLNLGNSMASVYPGSGGVVFPRGEGVDIPL